MRVWPFFILSLIIHFLAFYFSSTCYEEKTLNIQGEKVSAYGVSLEQKLVSSQKMHHVPETKVPRDLDVGAKVLQAQVPEAMGSRVDWNDLNEHIKKHLPYPALAKRLGLEGEAMALIKLNLDGKVEFIRWIKPFESEELSRLAQEYLIKLPDYKNKINQTELFQVPIVFKLK